MMRAFLVWVIVIVTGVCGGGGTGGGNDPDAGPPDDTGGRGEEVETGMDLPEDPGGPPVWESWYEPGVEKRGAVWVLRLKGSFYEMGRQHANLMRD